MRDRKEKKCQISAYDIYGCSYMITLNKMASKV